MHPNPSPAPGDGRRFLRCPTCGRADEVTQADLMRHANGAWPMCCGQVMDYVVGSGAHCPTCGRTGGMTFPAAAPDGTAVQIVCMLCALPSDAETKS
jgi:hypothetical protein